MKIDQVPQDKKNFRDGEKAPKKVMYVTTDEGQYTQTNSVGWEPENIVLEQAWEDIELQLKEEREKVKSGIVSPISYYMIKNRMDLPILASYAGKWQWQVKRHMKPAVFNKLPQKMLEKYADIFNIPVEQLKNAD
ncbi:MAG: hypothetical protein JNJ58_01090 [Chitinophagaceae bacterium]|nr:hypothetical protein [Chitinophagaceae bacterium]